MNRCAKNPSCDPCEDAFFPEKRQSVLVAYVAFAGSVIFTLAAASTLVTSDLPLPLF